MNPVFSKTKIQGRLRCPAAGAFVLCCFSLLIDARAVSVSLTADDAIGATSFNAAGNWNNAAAPGAANVYFNNNFLLRTPATTTASYTFGGSALTITSASAVAADLTDALIFKGTLVGNTTLTINNLTFNGGTLRNGSGDGNAFTLAGNGVTVGSLGMGVHVQGPLLISAPVLGSGPIKIVDPGSSAATRTLIFASPANTYTGSIELVALVNSRFMLTNLANLNFVIGASNVNNSVFGAGSATFNGVFDFNLSAAGTNLNDNWKIAAATVQTFGSTFSVAGFSRVGGGTGTGTWQAATNGAVYAFSTASGILQVVASLATNVVTAANPPVFAAPIEADLLASYAASYAASVGGEDNAQVIIANAVMGNNTVNDQSGTGAHMRVAGYYQSATDVTGQTTTGGIVGWLSGNNVNLADVVAQGAAVGADLVVYICNNTDSGSIAGVSQQPGMYSALNPGAVWLGVVAHETGGHAWGRSHSDGVPNPKTIMLHNYCGGGGAAPPYLYSNPNLWFNGVQLLGDGNNNCSMGSLVNGGDNSSCNAQAVADRRERVVAAPNLNHIVLHWAFTNAAGLAPSGTTNFDLVSGAPAVVRGNGAFYSGTTLRIPGGTSGNVAMDSMAAYLDLPNGIISARTNVTIEIWATPLSAPSWARIFDFGRTTQAGDGLGAAGEYTGAPGSAAPGSTSSSDDIMLSACSNAVINVQRFEAKLGGYATTLDSALPTTAGVPHHYAITFTDGLGAAGAAGGRWQWYRDGDAIAYLDVTNHLAAIPDVNNWLGRSMWSDDQNANSDYAEVRISSVALSRGEVLANYLLGPDYFSSATVALTNSDASGASSFAAAGAWGNGATPSGANSYETFDMTLRTPATGSSYAFGGGALKISCGRLLYKSTAGSSITVTNLALNGGAVVHGGSGTFTLAGNLATTNYGGTLNAVNSAMTLAASVSGGGPLTFLGNAVTLTGTNSVFTGRMFIGDGMAGAVAIDSPARLGASPANYTANQLTLNRGTLLTTANMILNDTNRGILLDISGGTFNVAAGTTLTLAGTLSSPVAPGSYNIVAGSLTKAGGGTLILNSPSNTFKGTLNVDSGSTSANDGVVKVTNNLVLANAHSPIFFRNNNAGSSTLQLDGTGGGITLPQQLALSGRTAASVAVQNVAGTNALSGGFSLNFGGSNYLIQSDAGLLNLGGVMASVATGSRTLTFLGGGNLNVAGVIADGSATMNVAKSGGGTLALGGNNTYSGTTTLSAGTLLVNGTLAGGGVTAAGGTLGGNGVINGAVTIQPGAILAPGAGAIGTLAISNSLTLAPGSVTRIEISKDGGALTNDFIPGLKSAAFDGTLIVTNLGSTNLSAGDTFRIFSSANYSGIFAATNLPPLPDNLMWQNRLAVDGTLVVASPVAPAPTNLMWSVTGTNLILSWPADHTGWRLLVQTGGLASGVSPNSNDWTTAAGSPFTNQISVPIDPALPLQFYRMVFP